MRFREDRCKNLGIAFGLQFLLDYIPIDSVWIWEQRKLIVGPAEATLAETSR